MSWSLLLKRCSARNPTRRWWKCMCWAACWPFLEWLLDWWRLFAVLSLEERTLIWKRWGTALLCLLHHTHKKKKRWYWRRATLRQWGAEAWLTGVMHPKCLVSRLLDFLSVGCTVCCEDVQDYLCKWMCNLLDYNRLLLLCSRTPIHCDVPHCGANMSNAYPFYVFILY